MLTGATDESLVLHSGTHFGYVPSSGYSVANVGVMVVVPFTAMLAVDLSNERAVHGLTCSANGTEYV